MFTCRRAAVFLDRGSPTSKLSPGDIKSAVSSVPLGGHEDLAGGLEQCVALGSNRGLVELFGLDL